MAFKSKAEKYAYVKGIKKGRRGGKRREEERARSRDAKQQTPRMSKSEQFAAAGRGQNWSGDDLDAMLSKLDKI